MSGNHNNPPEKSHYFWFSPLPLFSFSPHFHQISDTYDREIPPQPAHAARRSVSLLSGWITTLWRRSSRSYVTWNTLTRRAWRQRPPPPLLFVSLLSSVRSRSWTECCTGKLYTVLERTCKLTFNIKLAFKAVTAEHRVNSECSLSWLSPYMVKYGYLMSVQLFKIIQIINYS